MKKLILSVILATLLFSGCKTKEVVKYVDRVNETIKIDSIYQFLQDTMYLQKKGDTIYVNRIKVRIDYKYKFLNKTDSFKISVKEYLTITKKIPVEKIKWYGYGDIFILAILVLIASFKIYRRFFI
jgi:PBP1b-binding outer membrane lipoprotein LpoB